MKVILLGAGSSKCYKQSPSGLSMLIAKDFFQTFNKLEISENPWVLIDAILLYVMERENFSSFEQVRSYLSSGVDIESFHSEIASKKNLPTQSASSEGLHLYKAYNQLVFLFVSVINEIQNGPTLMYI